jgi:hypothetical protein
VQASRSGSMTNSPAIKRFSPFTDDEGGEEHIRMGALTLFHQRAFDWLDGKVKDPPRAG